jgi:hypothetical protein
VNNWAKPVRSSLSQAALDQQAAAAYSAIPQSAQVSDSVHVFELHIGTAFNDDVVLDASEAKVHISNILWVITKHAHDRRPKRPNKKIYLTRSNLSAKS